MPRTKLKIAIFHLAFIYSGGGERLVLEEALGLEKLGHDVTVFAPVIDRKKCFPELINKVNVKKILPRVLPTWILDHELFSILAACVLTPLFFYKFRQFDIYFGANQPGPWIAYLLSKINKKPYVIYLAQPTRLIHPRYIDQEVGLKIRDGFSFLKIMTGLLKPFIYFADVISIRNANTVFANGSYMSGVLSQIYRIKTINCPAGSNFSDKKFIPREKKFKGNIFLNSLKIKKPFALITNRHFPHKKFEYAIEALSLQNKKIPLVITGAPTEYTLSLKRKYKNKNLIFTDLLNEDDLDKVYANAAVYLYPAPEEDFGMGIVEAMRKGTPVVAWGNAGPTGIIEHGANGLLAKPFNIVDFASQIQKALTDKSLVSKINKNALAKSRGLFSCEVHVKLLNNFMLKQVLQSKKNLINSNLKFSALQKKNLPDLQFKEI